MALPKSKKKLKLRNDFVTNITVQWPMALSTCSTARPYHVQIIAFWDDYLTFTNWPSSGACSPPLQQPIVVFQDSKLEVTPCRNLKGHYSSPTVKPWRGLDQDRNEELKVVQMIYFLDIWISHTFTHVRFKFIKRTSWAHLPVRIQKCTSGRAYILRFTSSDKKMFFWMQEPSTDKDHCHCHPLPSLIPTNSAEVRDV